jgi:hypothetical protein
MKLANAVAHTSPEAIFLTGGIAAAGVLLLKHSQRYMEACVPGHGESDAFRNGGGQKRHSGTSWRTDLISKPPIENMVPFFALRQHKISVRKMAFS